MEALRLTNTSGPGLVAAAVYPLARALHSMGALSVLVLAQSASDNVLRVVAEACQGSLEELDVSQSRAVTDKGAAALVDCINLRVAKVTSGGEGGVGSGCSLVRTKRYVS